MKNIPLEVSKIVMYFTFVANLFNALLVHVSNKNVWMPTLARLLNSSIKSKSGFLRSSVTATILPSRHSR